MICKKCGAQVREGVSVCPSCGTQLIRDVSDLFVNPDERQIATVGGGYPGNQENKGRREKAYGILTDRRLYYRGKFYRLENYWMLYKTKEESIVDLQDITASGFVFRRNIILETIAGLATLIELLLIIAGLFASYDNVLEFWLFTLAVGVLTIVLWIPCIFLRRPVYRIFHAGGMIILKASANKVEQFRDFDRKLRHAKDEKVRELLGEGTQCEKQDTK